MHKVGALRSGVGLVVLNRTAVDPMYPNLAALVAGRGHDNAARAIGIQPDALQAVINGDVVANEDLRQRVAAVFGVPQEHIFELVPPI